MRMSLRLLSIILLSFFIFSSVGEARNSTVSHSSTPIKKQKVKAARHQKRKPSSVIARKKQPLTLAVKKKQGGKPTPRKQIQVKKPQKPQVKTLRKRAHHVSISKKKLSPQKVKPRRKVVEKKTQKRSILATKKKQVLKIKPVKQKPIVSKKSPQSRVIQKKVPKKPVSPNKRIDYFSHLNWHTQRNARIGKLDSLFSKNYLGQGQTVAVIETSGDWDEMQNVISGKEGSLPPVIREKYSRNFLPPIGDPGVDPNAKIDRSYSLLSASSDYHKHGSQVASVLLDLTHAKVLPVSTYKPVSGQSYDIADALVSLGKRTDVGVINISSGDYDYEIKVVHDQHYNPTFIYSFPPKHIDAFKAVAKAGKVVVLAAGNKGIELQTANDPHSDVGANEKYILHLLENLDPKTKESIIFAGNLDPDTAALRKSSNRPGTIKATQDAFLCAPGEVDLSYGYEKYLIGTSYAAPCISATIANICSRSPKITPKQAVRALLETAERRPDVRTYGRGIINAARALDWLEREVLK